MFMYGLGHFGWLGIALHLLLSLVVFVGLVLLVVWIVRLVFRKDHRSAPQSASGPTALDIAQERYAKGEITRKEYQQIVSDINK